jgi:hypothetical protein
MARIFLALSAFAVVLLLGSMIVGFMLGDLNGVARAWLNAQRRLNEINRDLNRDGDADEERKLAIEVRDEALRAYRPVRRLFTLHMLSGVAAALVTVLVNSVSVTYFIGTARWCREVVETYKLSPDLAERSQRLKRRTFPWALLGILSVLIIASLGAVSDPGANIHTSQHYVTFHLVASIAGTLAITWSFLMQVGNVGANYDVIEEILAEVNKRQAQPETPA